MYADHQAVRVGRGLFICPPGLRVRAGAGVKAKIAADDLERDGAERARRPDAWDRSEDLFESQSALYAYAGKRKLS
jgi:hypothetical protein